MGEMEKHMRQKAKKVPTMQKKIKSVQFAVKKEKAVVRRERAKINKVRKLSVPKSVAKKSKKTMKVLSKYQASAKKVSTLKGRIEKKKGEVPKSAAKKALDDYNGAQKRLTSIKLKIVLTDGQAAGRVAWEGTRGRCCFRSAFSWRVERPTQNWSGLSNDESRTVGSSLLSCCDELSTQN